MAVANTVSEQLLKPGNIRQRLQDDGYLVAQQSTPEHTMLALRYKLMAFFEERRHNAQPTQVQKSTYKQYRDIIPYGVNEFPELMPILFSPDILAICRTALGDDFVFLPENTVMRDYFNTLHTDFTEPELLGHNFHKESDFKKLTIGIYLQENIDNDGGMFLVPGSHNRQDPYVSIRLAQQAFERSRVKKFLAKLSGNRLYNYHKLLRVDKNGIDLPNKPGDALIFDGRLAHRASIPNSGKWTPKGEKLALFYGVMSNNRHVDAYIGYLRDLKRDFYSYIDEPRHPDIVRFCEKEGITLR